MLFGQKELSGHWSNFRVRLSAKLAGVVILFSFLSTVVNGVESWRDIFGWAIWIYERANTPWIGLFVLVVIGIIYWSGVQQVIRENATRSESENDAALLNEEIEDLRKYHMLAADISVIDNWINRTQILDSVEDATLNIRAMGDGEVQTSDFGLTEKLHFYFMDLEQFIATTDSKFVLGKPTSKVSYFPRQNGSEPVDTDAANELISDWYADVERIKEAHAALGKIKENMINHRANIAVKYFPNRGTLNDQ